MLGSLFLLLALSGEPQSPPKAIHAPVVVLAEPREDDAEERERAMELRHGGRPSAAYLEGKDRILQAEAQKWYAKRPFNLPVGISPPATSGGSWVNLGPGSLTSGAYSSGSTDYNSGRLTAIVTDPTNATTLYVATAGGGVWKSTNADLAATGDWTWTPITDSLPVAGADGNVPVGDLAMDPDDPLTLYLGLGDPLGAGNANGIWVTHDGGTTWVQSAFKPIFGATRRILPLGGGVVLAILGASGPLYRSTDGGVNFSSVSPKAGQVLIYDIAAFSSSELAFIGATSNASGLTPLFMYSSDGGQTWSDGILDASLTNIFSSPISGALACSRTGDGVGYALIPDAGTGNLAQGLARTNDKGHTWVFRASSQLFSASGDGAQASYNLFLTLDPSDSNHVYAGANFGTYRSLDGGQTWAQMTSWNGYEHVYAHADAHIGAWSKIGSKTLFAGNDGGLSVFRDPLRAAIPYVAGQSISDPSFVDNRRNAGIVSHLLFSVGSTTATNMPGARDFLLVGMQDNSTGTRLTSGTAFQLDPATGDGMGVLIHPLDARKAIASSYYDLLFRTTQFGSNSPQWTVSSPPVSKYFFTSVLPIPTDPDGVLTSGWDGIYQSHDFGLTYSKVPTTGLPISLGFIRPAASPFDAGIFAFTSFANPVGGITLDGGATWNSFGDLPSGSGVSWDISFSTSDPKTLYLTTQPYYLFASHLFKSTDLGFTWSPIDGSQTVSNGYPFGIMANVIRESPIRAGTLYVGTDLGVYVSGDGGASWSRLGNGLPYVRVEDLYIAPDGTFLRAATYGRGVWEVPLSTSGILVLDPLYLPHAPLGMQYSTTLSATGGTQPYTYAISRGSLPAGVSLSSAGALSGLPTTPGVYTFTVTCVDATGGTPITGSRNYRITVDQPILVQAPITRSGLLLNQAAAYSATALNAADPSVKWTASGGTLTQTSPTDASFIASTAGSYLLTATASADPTRSTTVTIQVHGADYTDPGHGVTGADALYIIGRLGGSDLTADMNGDGQIDQADLDLFLNLLGW